MVDKPNSDHIRGNDLSSLTCNVCGNELIIHYSKVRDTITDEDFAIYKCIKCGLGHTFPQPEHLKKYYDEIYYGNRHGFTYNYCLKRRKKFLLSALKDRDGNRLLDIGCGDAQFLRTMKTLEWDVVGTEINPPKESTEGLVVKENLDELSGCAQFDCITMWHTLEHMRDIRTTLSQVNSLLKPNGTLVIAVPNTDSFQAKIFQDKWLHLDVPRHLYHFDVLSLQNCLRTNGFVVEHQWYQELEYDLLGWTQSALNTIFSRPNIFFDRLRHKQKEHGQLVSTLNLIMGSMFIALSLPAVIVENLLNRSGTLITTARKGIK